VTADEPPRPGPRAAYASNWRTVLLVDAGLGLGLFSLGVVLMIVWELVPGAFVAAFGCTYLVVVLRRYGTWRELRRNAGLDHEA